MRSKLVFLGSGGARIVVARQVRASGGVWLSHGGTDLLIDPGPGALVKMTSSRHRIDPARLSGILLSHRHLDHSGDINNMIEAMTVGGTRPGGTLCAPFDALEGDDPVVLRYLREYLSEIVCLEERMSRRIGAVQFSCPVRHRHRGEVFGFLFELSGLRLALIADTAYFPELAQHYKSDVLVLNVVRYTDSDLDHLHAHQAERLIADIRPKLSILTHFGMTMIRARPWKVARDIAARTGLNVIAASDGKSVDLDLYRT